MSIKIIIVGLFAIGLFSCQKDQGLNIKGGHSHNDYYHQKPLMDALNSHMVSVEADVFPVNNKLMVGHSFDELKEGNTLEAMYLKPLYKLYNQQQLDTIILMIDIKTGGERSYQILKDKLHPYKEMFSQFTAQGISKNHVSLVLSGDRPKSILQEKTRWAALDGRIDSLSFQFGATYYPLISDDWQKHFQWNGKGAMSQEEFEELKGLVLKCHEQNKILRFWNIPGSPPEAQPFWTLFKNVGVDLIGVDNPQKFKM